MNIKHRIFILLLVFLTSHSMAQPEIKGTPDEVTAFLKPEAKTVSVSGHAEMVAFSDLAHVTVVVVTKEITLGSAMDKNSNIRSRITRELLDFGLTSDRINNSHFSSSPQYGWFGSKPSNFEVVNRLKVTIVSENELTFISKKADELEELSIGDIRFEHSEKDAYEAEVNLAALADAQGKATKYAELLGISLKPVSFNLSGAGQESFNRQRHRGEYGNVIEEVIVTASKRGGASAEVMQTPITFEEIRYQAFATVVLEVEHP